MGRGGCNCCGDYVTTALMSKESGVMQWNYSYGIDTKCLGVIDNEIVLFPSAGGWWYNSDYNSQMWKDSFNGGAKYDIIAGLESSAPSTKIIDTNGKLITQDIDFANGFGENLNNNSNYWYYFGDDVLNSSTLDINSTPSGVFITNRWIQMYASKDNILQQQSSILYSDDSGKQSIKGCENVQWDLFPQYIKPFRANVSSNVFWDSLGYFGNYNSWFTDINNNVMKYAAKNLTHVDTDIISIALRDSFCKSFRIQLIDIDDENFNFKATLDVDMDSMMQSYIDMRIELAKSILSYKELGIGGVGSNDKNQALLNYYHGGYTETFINPLTGASGATQQFPPSTITTKLNGTEYTFPEAPEAIYDYSWSGINIGYADGDILTPKWNFSSINISGVNALDPIGNTDNYIGNLRITSDPYQPSATFTIARKYFPVSTYLDGGSGIFIKAQTWDQAFSQVQCTYTINYDVTGTLGGVYSGESYWNILGFSPLGEYPSFEGAYNHALLDLYNQKGFYTSQDFGMNVTFNMNIFQGSSLWTPDYTDIITEVATIPGQVTTPIYALKPINFIHVANANDGSLSSFINLNDIVYNSSIYTDIVSQGDNSFLPIATFRQSFDYMDQAPNGDSQQTESNANYNLQSDSGLTNYIQSQESAMTSLNEDVVNLIPNLSLVVHSMSLNNGTYKVICTVPIDRVEYTYKFQSTTYYMSEYNFEHDYYYSNSGDVGNIVASYYYDKRGIKRGFIDDDPHVIVNKTVINNYIPLSGYKFEYGIQHYLLEIDSNTGTLLNYNQITGDMTSYLDLAARNKLGSTYAGETVWNRYSSIYSLGVSNENIYLTIDDNGANIGYSYMDSILSSISTGPALYYKVNNLNDDGTSVNGVNNQSIYYIPFDEASRPSGMPSNSTMDLDVESLLDAKLNDLHHNVIIGDYNGNSFEAHHIPSIKCTAPDLDEGYLYVGSINSSNRVKAVLANGLENVGRLAQIPQDDDGNLIGGYQSGWNDIIANNDAWQVYPHIYLIPNFHPETIEIPDYNLYPDSIVPGVNVHIGSTVVFIGIEDTALEVQDNLRAAGLTSAQVRGGPLLELTLDIGGINWPTMDLVDGFRTNDSPGLFSYFDSAWTQWVYNYQFTGFDIDGFGFWYNNYYYGNYWNGTWGYQYLDVAAGDTAQVYSIDKRLMPITDGQVFISTMEYNQYNIDNGLSEFTDYADSKGFDIRYRNNYQDIFSLLSNNSPKIYTQGGFVCPTMLFTQTNGGIGSSAKITYDEFISQDRFSENMPYPQVFDLPYMDSIGYPRSNNLFAGWMVKVENSTSTIQSNPAALYKFNVDGSINWTVHYGNLNYFDTSVPIGSGVEKSPSFCGVINDIKISSGNPYITGNMINLDTTKPKVFNSFNEYYNNVVCRRVAPTQLYFNSQVSYSGTISDCLLNLDDDIRISNKWFRAYEKIKVFN